MSTFMLSLRSSIIKKQIMATTGLLLCGFLISHLLGNCLIYLGANTFNNYAHTLTSNPMIYPAEAILLIIFFTHVFLAIKLTMENKAARPQKYSVVQKTGRGATIASSTMPYTGVIVLIFLIKHLLDFKYGPIYMTQINGVEVRDLYKTIINYFQSPLNVAQYIFCMLILSLHIGHGVWSAFQSFGINHSKYNCCIKLGSKCFALIIFFGYSALPIFCYFQGSN